MLIKFCNSSNLLCLDIDMFKKRSNRWRNSKSCYIDCENVVTKGYLKTTDHWRFTIHVFMSLSAITNFLAYVISGN